MSSTSPHHLFKLIGLALVAIGVVALVARVTPVSGQTERRSTPFTEFQSAWFGLSSLGASLRDVDETDVRRDSLSSSAGAVVEDVRADGPAARAGMRAGDVVLTFDGERVRSARHLMRLADETGRGREVGVTVLRAGKSLDLKITPVAGSSFAALEPLRREFRSFTLPDSLAQMSPRLRREWSDERPASGMALAGRRLGIEIQNVSGQLASYFGTTSGVLVTSVEAGSVAATAGLRAGDVVTAVGGAAVRDTEELRRRLNEAAPETTITVTRDRKETTLKVQFKDDPVEADTPRRIVK
jgi:serine protease Do